MIDAGNSCESGLGSLGTSATTVSTDSVPVNLEPADSTSSSGLASQADPKSLSVLAGQPSSPTPISDSCKFRYTFPM